MRTTFITNIIENSTNIFCDSIITGFNCDENFNIVVNGTYNCLDIDH